MANENRKLSGLSGWRFGALIGATAAVALGGASVVEAKTTLRDAGAPALLADELATLSRPLVAAHAPRQLDLRHIEAKFAVSIAPAPPRWRDRVEELAAARFATQPPAAPPPKAVRRDRPTPPALTRTTRRTPMAQLVVEATRELTADSENAIRDYFQAPSARPIWAALRAPDPDPRASQRSEGSDGWARANALLEALAAAPTHALPAGRYDLADLHAIRDRARAALDAVIEQAAIDPRAWESGDPTWGRADRERAARDRQEAAWIVAAMERRFSEAYLTYARDVGTGFLEPSSVDPEIDRQRPHVQAAALVRLAAHTTDAPGLLALLHPQSEDYAALRRAYGHARAALENETLPTVGGKTLRPGMRSEAVTALRARLIALGDLDDLRVVDPKRYDAPLEAAVRRFQARHGLVVDGLAGRRTFAAVNRGARELVAQFAANMERARWLNYPLGNRRIVVNLPDFHAELIDDGEVLLRTRVVIGEAPDKETPEFSDQMEYMVVNPRWHVPHSIATKLFLPKLQDNPDALAAKGMTVLDQGGGVVDPWNVDWSGVTPRTFRYRVRQAPGPQNALGDVKFMFPNEHAIYLHDTPARSLFRRQRRDFSHGCVRVADPEALAAALLAAQSAEPQRFYDRLRRREKEQYVNFDAPVPVHIDYRTAWFDAEGVLQIRDDVYGRDAALIDALFDAGAPLGDAEI